MAEADPRDDEALTALLDGELDPAAADALRQRLAADPVLRARHDRLRLSGLATAGTFETLKAAAPTARLEAMLQRALDDVPAQAPASVSAKTRRDAPRWRLSPVMALAAMIVVAIFAGGVGFAIGTRAPKPAETWQQAVAEYWQLTTAKTLTLVPAPELAESQLALAGEALGVSVAPGAVALDGLSFRGAQLYEFRGKPLVQIAYIDPDYGPIAYCVIRNGKDGEQPRITEVMEGFEVVHWQGGGYGRMIIGRAPPERLARFAEQLAAVEG